MNNLEKELTSIVGVENIRFYENMKNHTTFKIGGRARIFIIAKTQTQLISCIDVCNNNKIPWFVIGSGSNLLVKDGGINGVVFQVYFNYNNITVSNTTITCESGASLTAINKKCLSNALVGMEDSFIIPGTIGGAVVGNAGAYGFSIGDVVSNVTFYHNGEIKTYTQKECKFTYRHSIFKTLNNFVILQVTLTLKIGEQKTIKERYMEILNHRISTQPLNEKSAGSIFLRDGDVIPAKLIDELNLKGHQIGDAKISTKHAGFIINSGNATARDVLNLIDFISKKVYTTYKVVLQPEIRVIGED